MLHTLQERNPGTYVDIQDSWFAEDSTVKILERVFFSFNICIEAFRYCRPVLCVDGTFLTGKYKAQILTAIGQDGNNQIVPLAFAFVESENTESWLWFFRQIKIAIVKERPNVCLLVSQLDILVGFLICAQETRNTGLRSPRLCLIYLWRRCLNKGL
jgi:hypothetical protein